jgi:cellobiose-specific phosphotransferase system component IIA
MAVVSGDPRSRKRRGPRLSRHQGPTWHLNREQTASRWATIETMANGNGNDLRNAVSEADKLFDHVLLQSGLARSSMGERLKAARTRFSSYEIYDAVWKAHKLRTALAHEVGFDLVASQARQAVADFGRGLRDLGAL